MVKSSAERKAKAAKSQLKTIKGSAHSLNVSNRTAKEAGMEGQGGLHPDFFVDPRVERSVSWPKRRARSVSRFETQCGF